MKKTAALVLALMLALCAVCAPALGAEMEKLTLQFAPAREDTVLLAATRNLPQLLREEMAALGYDIAEVEISVGTSFEATGAALAAGDADVAWLSCDAYAACSQDGAVEAILAATGPGLSNDSIDPIDWNGDENRTTVTGEPAIRTRALIYAAPSEKGIALAAKVNAGEDVTWDELNDCIWAVGGAGSPAGYVYPSMWLMDNYAGKRISDLYTVISLGYDDAFMLAAAGQIDIFCGYADVRCDYEEIWNPPMPEPVEAGEDAEDAEPQAAEDVPTGLGRVDSIWNEVNVIGVTEGICRDAVAVTASNPDVCDPDFIAALQTALIDIIGTEEGAEIFSVLGHAGYAAAGDGDYEAARRALTVMR